MNVQTCSYVQRLIKRVRHTYLGLYVTSKEVFGRDDQGFQDACPFLVLQKKGCDRHSRFNYFQLFWNFREIEIIGNK